MSTAESVANVTSSAEVVTQPGPDLSSLTAEEALFGGAVVGAALTGMLIALAVVCLILIIADWKIFTKAGEAGWKSIIPILNTYTEYKISWLGIFGLVESIGLFACNVFSKKITSYTVLTPMLIITLTLTGIVLVLHIVQSLKLAKAFGKGTGFGIGLILLAPIFRLILGFGSAQYVGEAKKEAPETDKPEEAKPEIQ